MSPGTTSIPMESQPTDFAKRRANHRAVYETKKEKYLSYFRIVDYDREIAIKAERLMSKPIRPHSNAQSDETAASRLVSCPHKRESIISAKPLFDACFPRA
jgi:hypothetical protein